MRECVRGCSFLLYELPSKALILLFEKGSCNSHSMLRVIVFLFMFELIACARPLADTAVEGDIPRFGIVSDGLYRGGQPNERGFQFLKEKGVKTVINLRAEDNSEQAVVEKFGMKYIRIPLNEVFPWTRIPPGAIAKYFELVNNPENYPIFFHCR